MSEKKHSVDINTEKNQIEQSDKDFAAAIIKLLQVLIHLKQEKKRSYKKESNGNHRKV